MVIMANFTVLLAAVILALLVDVGWCRFAGGGSLDQLRDDLPQFGPGEENLSGLNFFPDSSDGLQLHGSESGEENDFDGFDNIVYLGNDNYDGYEPGPQELGGEDEEPDYGDDDADHVDMESDRNASHIAPDKYITVGSPTGIKQYPWVVHLVMKYQLRKEARRSACGGSLVSWRHVITAAHCVNHKFNQYEDVRIYLAEYNTRTFPTDCVGSQCIRNVLMHPDKITIHQLYQPGIWHNDIAMMRLKGSAPNTGHIRPIALPTFNINHARNDGKPLMVTGWGRTEYGKPSSIKLRTQVHLVAPNTCKRYHPVTKGMLCTVGKNGKNRCSGDSGGPLMAKYDGQFHLVGLVSFRKAKSCMSPVPSMYTNVYFYLNWIQYFMRH